MCFLSYAFLFQDTTTCQIDRVQRKISEPYELHCLKDNIEKKRRTFFERTLVFIVFVVVLLLCLSPCTYMVLIGRKGRQRSK